MSNLPRERLIPARFLPNHGLVSGDHCSSLPSQSAENGAGVAVCFSSRLEVGRRWDVLGIEDVRVLAFAKIHERMHRITDGAVALGHIHQLPGYRMKRAKEL